MFHSINYTVALHNRNHHRNRNIQLTSINNGLKATQYELLERANVKRSQKAVKEVEKQQRKANNARVAQISNGLRRDLNGKIEQKTHLISKKSLLAGNQNKLKSTGNQLKSNIIQEKKKKKALEKQIQVVQQKNRIEKKEIGENQLVQRDLLKKNAQMKKISDSYNCIMNNLRQLENKNADEQEQLRKIIQRQNIEVKKGQLKQAIDDISPQQTQKFSKMYQTLKDKMSSFKNIKHNFSSLKTKKDIEDKVKQHQTRLSSLQKQKTEMQPLLNKYIKIQEDLIELSGLDQKSAGHFKRQFCKKLSLSQKKFDQVCKLLNIAPLPTLQSIDISQIEAKPKATSKLSSGRSIEQLLAELFNSTQEQQLDRRIRDQIQTIYNKFKQSNQKIQKYSKQEIRKFGKSLKKTSDLQLGNLLAYANRANQIVTGFELRPAQILAVILFYISLETKNRFCQIKTGEGKTTIISVIAFIEVMNGKRVDVITSNEVLAREAVQQKKKFYSLFDISVVDNRNPPEYSTGPKKCYYYDVCYGNITNFQFDYLKHEYQNKQTRGSRIFSTVIIDEADNIILDNAAHTARLSEPIAGFSKLREFYLSIWLLLIKFQRQLELTEIPLQEITAQQKQKIKDKLLASRFESQLPTFLKGYLEDKREDMMDGAIKARFDFHQDRQYILNKSAVHENQLQIVPIDKDVGITLQMTKLTNIHPFLQIKHNLYITDESLSGIFVANYIYIKLYSKIFGMTGTLGSKCERSLIKQIYQAKTLISPSFKKSLLIPQLCTVTTNEEWTSTIVNEATRVQKQRAVLIICKTIEDLLQIEKKLKELASDKIIVYKDQRDADVISELNQKKVSPKSIIIATNIGGRGTDLKLSQEVLKNGGLHVVITFLSSERVLKQAAGRAGRQGEPGSCCIIISQKQAGKFNLQLASQSKFPITDVFDWMDKYYNDIHLQDGTSKKRQQYIKNRMAFMQQENKKLRELGLYLNDLYNNIAIDIQNDLKSHIAILFDRPKQSQEEWSVIQNKLKEAVQNPQSYKHQFHNPFYAIRYCQSLLFEGNFSENGQDKSVQMVREVCRQGCFDNSSFQSYALGLQMLAFFIQCHSLNTFINKFKQFVQGILPFKIEEVNKQQKMREALGHLQRAKKICQDQISKLQAYLESEDFEMILLPKEDLNYQGENYIMKQYKSKHALKIIQHSYISQLLDSIQQNLRKDVGVFISAVLTLEDVFQAARSSKQNSETIGEIGLIRSYQIKESYNVGQKFYFEIGVMAKISIEDPKIIQGLALIGAGIASFALAAIPFIGPIISGATSVNLIVAGVVDILLRIIQCCFGSENQFDAKSFIADIGLELGFMSIGKIFKILKVFKRISKVGGKFMKPLAKMNFWKRISNSRLWQKVRDLGRRMASKRTLCIKRQLRKKAVKCGLETAVSVFADNKMLDELKGWLKREVEDSLIRIFKPAVLPITTFFFNFVENMNSQLKDMVNNLFESLPRSECQISLDNLQPLELESIKQTLLAIYESITELAHLIFDKYEIVMKLFHHIQEFFQFGIKKAVAPILDSIRKAKGSKLEIINLAKDLISGDIKDSIKEVISSFREVIPSLGALNPVEMIQQIWSGVEKIKQTMVNLIRTAINFNFEPLKDKICSFLVKKLSSLISVQNPIIKYLSNMHIDLKSADNMSSSLMKLAQNVIINLISSKIKKQKMYKGKQKAKQPINQNEYKQMMEQKDCVFHAVKQLFSLKSNKAVILSRTGLKLSGQGETVNFGKMLVTNVYKVAKGELKDRVKQSKATKNFHQSSSNFLANNASFRGIAFLVSKGQALGHAMMISQNNFSDNRQDNINANQLYDSGEYLTIQNFNQAQRMCIQQNFDSSKTLLKRQIDSFIEGLRFGAPINPQQIIFDMTGGIKIKKYYQKITRLRQQVDTLRPNKTLINFKIKVKQGTLIAEKLLNLNCNQIDANQLKTKSGDVVSYWMNLKDLYPATFLEYQKVNVTQQNPKSNICKNPNSYYVLCIERRREVQIATVATTAQQNNQKNNQKNSQQNGKDQKGNKKNGQQNQAASQTQPKEETEKKLYFIPSAAINYSSFCLVDQIGILIAEQMRFNLIDRIKDQYKHIFIGADKLAENMFYTFKPVIHSWDKNQNWKQVDTSKNQNKTQVDTSKNQNKKQDDIFKNELKNKENKTIYKVKRLLKPLSQ